MNQIIEWIKTRRDVVQKQRDELDINKNGEYELTIGKGGQLTAFNQVLAYIETHGDSEEKFSVEEIRNYIVSQDSMGDILYFLSAENIRKANQEEEYE